MTVDGDVTGTVEAELDLCMEIGGSLTSNGVIKALILSEACGAISFIDIGQDVEGTIEIESDLLYGAYIQVDGKVTSSGQIKMRRLLSWAHRPPSNVWVDGDCDGLILVQEVNASRYPPTPIQSRIHVEGALNGPSGKIIIASQEGLFNGSVAGKVIVDGGGDGKIEIGTVTSDPYGQQAEGLVQIGGPDEAPATFSGQLLIWVQRGQVEIQKLAGTVGGPPWVDGGRIQILDGELAIKNDFMSGALIKVFDLVDDGYGRGTITISQAANVGAGDISVSNTMTGEVDINGDYRGDITITADNGVEDGATIDISGKLKSAGDIEIDNDLGGVVNIGTKLAGDVAVAGDLTSTGSVDVGAKLSGRVLVDGLCDGAIAVEQQTLAGSLIRAIEGLGADGTIEINTNQGANNANGDIFIGDPGVEFVTVWFDGCIRVYDDGSEGDGDLNGDIDVVGCHLTDDDLIIQIDGDINGTITIDDAACEHQPGVDDGPCPPA